jgi:lycopene beta-cyclase
MKRKYRARRGIVVGAGPAGRAIASALGNLGIEVLCVDAAPERPWRTTWGMWDDEVCRLGLDPVVAATAPAPRVRLVDGDDIVLPRAYHVLDPERLRQHLSATLSVGTAQVHTTAPDQIACADGQILYARFVIDARGPPAASASGCAQTAFGRVVRARGLPALLMDFSIDHHDDDVRPSFGYLVPLDREHLLVEETALAASPPMAPSVLERRLDTRLRALGLETAVTNAPSEWVHIPLDVDPARTRSGVLRFGVAGGSVHPATGYTLARVLDDAPRLAGAVRQALDRGDDPPAIAQAAQRALWTPERQMARHLLNHGRDMLLPLDLAGQRAFFRAFFRLSPPHQRAFLGSASTATEVARSMLALFPGLSWPLRARAFGLPNRVGELFRAWSTPSDRYA